MSALTSTAIRRLPPAASHATTPPSVDRAVRVGADYTTVYGPGGVIDQAKEGFIAARFSPSQPLRIKRAPGLRALQSIPLPDPSETFSYFIPWELETLAA